MKYKQNKPYGCGLYAVANACNLDNFVTEERLEKSKNNGNTIGQLSKWLQEDGNPFAIDSLYYNHLGKKLPASALGYRPLGDANFLPILLNVRYSDEGLNHMVGGKIDKNGTLFLYDSLKEDIIETTLAKVNNIYKVVYGLFIFSEVETGEYAFI